MLCHLIRSHIPTSTCYSWPILILVPTLKKFAEEEEYPFLLLCDCWLLLSSMSPDAIVEGDRTVISLGEWSQCQQSPSIPSLISIPQCTLGVSLSQLVSQLKQKTGNFFLINHLDHSGQTKSFISFSCLPSTLASESPAEHSRFQGRFSRQNEFLKSYFYSYL